MIYRIYDICTCFKISTGMILTALKYPVIQWHHQLHDHLSHMSSVSYLPILPMLDGCFNHQSKTKNIEISLRAPYHKKHPKIGGYPRVDIDKDVENIWKTENLWKTYGKPIWKTYGFPKFFQWFHLQVHLFPGGIITRVISRCSKWAKRPQRGPTQRSRWWVSTHRDFWRNTGNIWEIRVNI